VIWCLSFDEFKKHDCPSCNDYALRYDTQYAVAKLSFHLNSSDQEGTVEAFWRALDRKGNVLTYYNALRRHAILVCAPSRLIRLLDGSAISLGARETSP
jgi:hypothetical protein